MGSGHGLSAVSYTDCHCGKVAATSCVSEGKIPPGNTIIDLSDLNKQQNISLTSIHDITQGLSVNKLNVSESGPWSSSYSCAFNHFSPATASFLHHNLL